MSDRDAYEDEMRRFLQPSDADLDRLLDGTAPAGDERLGDLAAFLADTREALREAPTDATEARHLPAMVEAAQLLADKGEPAARPASKATGPARQASGLPKWRRNPMRNRVVALTAKVVAGAMIVMTMTVGFALAGVDLPGEAAEDAIEQVLGVDVPGNDQDRDEIELVDTELEEGETDDLEGAEGPDENASPTAFAVFDVIVSWIGERDCNFGQAVAGAASGSDPTTDFDPCTQGEDEEGETRAAEGKATGEAKASEGKTTGEQASQSGQQTGSDAADAGQSNAGGSQQTGEKASDDGQSNAGGSQETGDEASDDGQSNGSQQTGDEASDGAGRPDSTP